MEDIEPMDAMIDGGGLAAPPITSLRDFYAQLEHVDGSDTDYVVLMYRDTGAPLGQLHPWDVPKPMTHYAVTTPSGVRKFQRLNPTTFTLVRPASPAQVARLHKELGMKPFQIEGDMASMYYIARLRTETGPAGALVHREDCACPTCEEERRATRDYFH
jgi:hypothetical protein